MYKENCACMKSLLKSSTKDQLASIRIETHELNRNEEVQAIIDRMPTQWARYVAIITGLLICGILLLGFLIKYPDTVDGQISITSHQAPIRLVANYTGKIHLLKDNGAFLRKGEVIAYIESGAEYNDILHLDSLLKTHTFSIAPQFFLHLPDTLILGEVSSQYNAFVVAYAQYERTFSSDLYTTMRTNLENTIRLDEEIIINMQKEVAIRQRIIDSVNIQLYKDSSLRVNQIISDQEYKQQYNEFLNLQEVLLNQRSNILSKKSNISQNKIEIQKIELEENEIKEKVLTELISSKNELENAINVWKERYLQYSPIEGDLEYLGFWRNNSFITSGDQLFTVIPDKDDFFGEILIPAQGAGKVKIGQPANIKLLNFPYDEYGLLKGRVHSISRITNTIKTQDGTTTAYLVTVSFPNGTKTNFGINLPLDFETKGTVEIITKQKRLIERLFDNLKTQQEK